VVEGFYKVRRLWTCATDSLWYSRREERRGLDGTGKAYHFYLDQQMNTLGHRMSNADYAVAKFLETHPSHPRRQEILYKESL
jgi:hypothetical protein